MHARASLLRNDGGNERRWVRFSLVGRESNRDGVGARLVLEAGSGRSQTRTAKAGGGYLSSHDPRVSFGLGNEGGFEKLRVHWPSGRVEVLESLPTGRGYIIKEGVGVVAERP